VKPQIRLGGIVEAHITTRKNKKPSAVVSKSTRANEKVSEQRLKRRDEATYFGKSLPTIDLCLAGEREVNDGENEGGLETRNGRMKVFIGVQWLTCLLLV
jgi:hypothetical protein